ncbi:hypothetical protein A1O3_06874 [Capronia epimyces CBS 606.96]|uniref:Luciferase-like domain-containing protein n=1 Tax=Capronia epimyces CBS 606.96 TaxID=1182542 RepID=W9XJ97_9EURO|nr:uncharacterized protein A1O3_06874 [Capronia epimyces CBS 606.96]EXJ80592.1 hypothetical protein A1O3_06874 [Capronia epimyces CBS 606.96]
MAEPIPQEQAASPKKVLFLNAFDLFAPSHLSFGQWRNPKDKSSTKAHDLTYWTTLAQILERGGYHCLVLSGWPISAMAAVTKNLAFAITGSTSYETPYAFARRFSTLDHLTKGRIGWNIVTSYNETGARAVGKEIVEHDRRYEIADEFLRAVYKLWEGSWADDALVKDAEKDTFADYDRIRFIHHRSENFKFDGPHALSPSPQRTPFLFQAGTSGAGIGFASVHAEGVFVAARSPHILAPSVKEIRRQAALAGRDPRSIKVVASITPIIGRTSEEAQAKYQEAQKYASVESGLAFFSNTSGIDISQYDLDRELVASDATIDHRVHSLAAALDYRGDDISRPTPRTIGRFIAIGGSGATPVGTAEEVADILEEWADIADLDGFNIGYVTTPGTFEDVVDLLVPELRKRGRYAPKGESTGTLRERVYGNGQAKLRDDHIGHSYRYDNSEIYAEQDKLPKK